LFPVMSEEWMDENGNVAVAGLRPPQHFFEPFDVFEDPWCDFHFLCNMPVFKDVQFPSHEEYYYRYGGDDYIAKLLWERDEHARLRAERPARKAWLKEYWAENPDLRHRQKKQGRTKRRRRRAYVRRFDAEYEAQYGNCEVTPFRIQPGPDYDENILKTGNTGSWHATFWLMSFLDDNVDYKMVMADRNKLVYWPAEQTPKRTLGYELLEFMAPDKILKRTGSVCTLERQRNWEVAAVRVGAAKLKRSKSESDLTAESTQWNPLKTEDIHEIEQYCDKHTQEIDDSKEIIRSPYKCYSAAQLLNQAGLTHRDIFDHTSIAQLFPYRTTTYIPLTY
ncbi:hypothetical protein PMAYCL1PPCAC_32335, partial [Pristionchus mayeri]